MAADELSAPLGQEIKRRRRFSAAIIKSMPQAIAVALGIFLGGFVLWAVVADNPFGGEPMVAVPIDPHVAMAPKIISGPVAREAGTREAGAPPGPTRYDGPAEGLADGPVMIPVPAAPANAGNTRTVTIIDGKTGARQDVVIPGGPMRRARPMRRALPRPNRPTRNWSKPPLRVPFRKLRPTACGRRKPMRSR